MLTSDSGQLEVVELEAWLDAECPCEAGHNITICSYIVFALVVGCDGSTKACQNFVTYKLESMHAFDCA